jgi:hypothetical protein
VHGQTIASVFRLNKGLPFGFAGTGPTAKFSGSYFSPVAILNLVLKSHMALSRSYEILQYGAAYGIVMFLNGLICFTFLQTEIA